MPSRTRSRLGIALLALVLAAVAGAVGGVAADEPERTKVPAERVRFDDGDSLAIEWPDGREEVRILGIDAPEVQHLDHDIPYAQPFGEKAAGFLEGALAVARKIELLRSGQKDDYGRTLGYLFLDGRNYSVLVLRARLAVETVSHYGDNGLPEPAAACLAAAKEAGPVAFEPPYRYRARMRAVTRRLREEGRYPLPSDDE